MLTILVPFFCVLVLLNVCNKNHPNLANRFYFQLKIPISWFCLLHVQSNFGSLNLDCLNTMDLSNYSVPSRIIVIKIFQLINKLLHRKPHWWLNG